MHQALANWLQMTVSLLAWLVLSIAIFVPLERWFAAKRPAVLRPQWKNDLVFYFLGG